MAKSYDQAREAHLMRNDASRILEDETYNKLRNEELLRALASQYSKDIPQIVARSVEWIRAEVPIETARAEALAMWQRANGQQPVASIPLNETAQYGRSVSNFVGMSKKDLSSYSFSRILAASANLIEEKDLGLEREIHTELLRNLPSERRPFVKGLLVPHDLFANRNFVNQRAAYAVGANSTGGYAVQTDVLADSFVEALRPVSMALQLGAKTLSGLQGNASIPTQASTSSVYWVAENGALTESESTMGALSLTPKTYGIYSKYSRLMLLQANPDIEALIRQDFARGMAVGLDAAIIGGSGTANQPTGILNNSGCQTYAVSEANGRALNFLDLIEMEYLAASANALSQNLVWIGNAGIRKSLRKTPKQSSGVEANFCWEEIPQNLKDSGYDSSIFGSVLGYLFGCTENVPKNFSKGTSSTLNGLAFGPMENVLIGQWGGLEVLSNPYSQNDFAAGITSVRALQSVDLAIRNPESWVCAKQFA